jgi:hypothetical protein
MPESKRYSVGRAYALRDGAGRDRNSLLRVRAALIAVVIMAATACGTHGESNPPQQQPIGTLVGHIDTCAGMIGPGVPPYTGGTVVVLRGVVHAPKANRNGRPTLPTDAVGRQTVASGGEFRFALPPGPYVLDLPHYIGSNFGTYWSVVVRAGTTVRSDIPSACK